MPAEGLEEEERRDLIEGSSNKGHYIEASIHFEYVYPLREEAGDRDGGARAGEASIR
jgi:hypothetical protein